MAYRRARAQLDATLRGRSLRPSKVSIGHRLFFYHQFFMCSNMSPIPQHKSYRSKSTLLALLDKCPFNLHPHPSDLPLTNGISPPFNPTLLIQHPTRLEAPQHVLHPSLLLRTIVDSITRPQRRVESIAASSRDHRNIHRCANPSSHQRLGDLLPCVEAIVDMIPDVSQSHANSQAGS